jgi:tetratricopeptide (TPR) repeat protein
MHEHQLHHQAFFAALSALPSEDAPEWHGLGAELVVLRLADRVLDDVDPLAESEVIATRRAIDRVENDPLVPSILRATVDAIAGDDLGTAARRLRDVGRVHLSRAAWPLAVDVFETGTAIARAAQEEELTLECLLLGAHAIRMRRRFVDAERQYARLAATAAAAGSVRYQLEAELGLGKLATDRGDFPDAQARLDAVIQRARDVRCTVVLSKALQDRARLAGERGDYVMALEMSYEALRLSEDVRERDRILGNVAHALGLLGRRDAARDANLILAGTAQERDVRWHATVSLMEIAYLDGRSEAFERYHVQLAAEPLPPVLAASYYQCVGAGYAAFDRRADATVAYSRMLSIAEEHGLAEPIITAERALVDLRARGESVSPAAPPTRARVPREPAVARIASAIRQQRIAAGIHRRPSP